MSPSLVKLNLCQWLHLKVFGSVHLNDHSGHCALRMSSSFMSLDFIQKHNALEHKLIRVDPWHLKKQTQKHLEGKMFSVSANPKPAASVHVHAMCRVSVESSCIMLGIKVYRVTSGVTASMWHTCIMMHHWWSHIVSYYYGWIICKKKSCCKCFERDCDGT